MDQSVVESVAQAIAEGDLQAGCWPKLLGTERAIYRSRASIAVETFVRLSNGGTTDALAREIVTTVFRTCDVSATSAWIAASADAVHSLLQAKNVSFISTGSRE